MRDVALVLEKILLDMLQIILYFQVCLILKGHWFGNLLSYPCFEPLSNIPLLSKWFADILQYPATHTMFHSRNVIPFYCQPYNWQSQSISHFTKWWLSRRTGDRSCAGRLIVMFLPCMHSEHSDSFHKYIDAQLNATKPNYIILNVFFFLWQQLTNIQSTVTTVCSILCSFLIIVRIVTRCRDKGM